MRAPTPPEPSPGEGLSGVAIRGVRWVAAARLIAEIGGVASVLVTARVLTPTEVGQAALGLVVAALAASITQQGFGAPIVQRKLLTQTDVASAQAMSLTSGVLAGGIFALVGLLLIGNEEIGRLVATGSVCFPLAAAMAIPIALSQRELDFRTLSIVEAAASIAGVVAVIAGALAGVGGLALLLGPITLFAVTAIALTTRHWKDLWAGRPTVASARETTEIGGPAALAGALYTATQNVDYVVLSAKLPAEQVGYYYRAFQLGVEYQGKVSGILLRAALPLYSRTIDEGQRARARRRIVQAHTVTLFPALTTLLILGPELVHTLFGPQWDAAARPAQILAVAGMANVVASGTGPLLTSIGQTRPLAWFAAGELVLLTSAVAFSADYGLVAVCIAVAIARVSLTIVSQAWLVARYAGIPARDTLGGDLLPSLASSLALAAVALALATLARNAGWPPFLVCLVAAPPALATYAATLRVCFPSAWQDLLALAGR